MSTTAEHNAYESTGQDPESEKMYFEAYGSSPQLIYIPDMECESQQALLSVTNENDVLLRAHAMENVYPEISQSSDCYADGMSTIVIGNEETSLKNTILSTPKLEQVWNEEEICTSEMDAVPENIEMVQTYDNDVGNVEDSDEETIATFMTAAGQRLALYAVEDSDQVFAVAVYDESGEPPTNFQFLMKSDVERLIGEGAVRTVKKPTQMKKQLVTNQPPSLQESVEQPLISTETEVDESSYRIEFNETSNKTEEIVNSKRSKICHNTQKESSLNDRRSMKNLQIKEENTFITDSNTDLESFDQDFEQVVKYEKEVDDSEIVIIERSTVNNLLMDDKSDEELTFADVQESLENFVGSKAYSSNERLLDWHEEIEENSQISCENDTNYLNDSIDVEHENKREENVVIAAVKVPAKVLKKTNLVRKIHLSSSLITRRDGSFVQREENKSLPVEDALKKSDRIPETTSPKAKRPRKQQLTSVNRGDSEIIIQPATFSSEDEEVVRKRTYRRRRKTVRTVRYKMRNSVAKRLEKRRGRRPNAEVRKQYELIEIDVDEKDRLAAKEKSIVEITLDENKEKGSSDKENEVIMVGDSDDDDEAETSTSVSGSSSATAPFECEHCFRNFRQKGTLKTHLRICPKSPKKGRPKSSTRPSESYPKKQFVCKICQEKFDVVVVLARHVKAMHSMKKRGNARVENAESSSTSVRARKAQSPSTDDESDDGTESSRTGVSNSSSMKTRTRTRIKRIRSKRRKRRKTESADRPGWKGQKLHCSDCAKWFSSSALLASHALQHATKKSEKQFRRCQTCKKILKSRLLYIRHLRMHSRDNNKLQKKLYHTRQTNADLATLRKRGRPRKL